MAVLNNLYPPIVDTYMPAFLVTTTEGCRVYFSISLYNTREDIMNAQVVVTDQLTNTSVLNETDYPSGIALKTVYEDKTKNSEDRYYILISPNDFVNRKIEINRYYKLQIRFTSADAVPPPYGLTVPQRGLESWLQGQMSMFSEWSTVCLIRGISTPRLTIPGFDTTADYSTWTIPTVTIDGRITFSDPEETETLKSYRIKLYNEAGSLLVDTDDIYTNQYVGINELNYTFKYNFADGEVYRVVIEYLTKNLYTSYKEYNFMVILGTSGKLDATLYSIRDNENGRIGVNIVGNTKDKFTGNITIRRTSSESDFTIWEDVNTFTIKNEILNYTWYDCTVKSGVWYKYVAQRRDSIGNRGTIVNLKNPVMIDFEHIYLTAQGKQINIKFDPDISSFKRTVAESKTDTIGSKYPYIKRNGYTNYRQFPISGTITHWMDEDNLLFASEKDIYKNTLELYEDYNWENKITEYNNYTYERDFREKVMDFLYENNVKLFRSPTEGNILVKLMDINFTPNKVLGRMIYSFSCTAYEIADFTVENCNLYNIQPLGEVDHELRFIETFTTQIKEVIPKDTDVMDVLKTKFQKLVTEDYIVKIEYLDYLRIEMEQDPYLIKDNGAYPYPIVDIDPTREDGKGAYLGYICKINGVDVVINPEGIYELKGEGVSVTSLTFPVDTQVCLDCHVAISQTEDKSKVPISINYYKRMGQYWGVFDYKDSVYQKIWEKYFESYSTYIQNLLGITEISIEANPGTVVYVAETKEKDLERHVIGDTCRLDFSDKDSGIIGLYFAGVHFEEATDYEKIRDELPDHKYIDTGIIVDSLDEIKNPKRNGVYTLSGAAAALFSEEEDTYKVLTKVQQTSNEMYNHLLTKANDIKYMKAIAAETQSNKYIWYNNKWWIFTDGDVLLCPVEASVNYCCEFMKGMLQT